MYRYMNMNPKGRNIDDCVLRAISCATGKSWDYVYEHLSDIARSEGKMIDSADFVQDYLDSRYERIPYARGTVGEISKRYKDNILLITMKNHITCSKFGNIYDTFNCLDKPVEYVWIVD